MFAKSIQSSFALCAAAAAAALAGTMIQTTSAFAPLNIAHRSKSSSQNTGSALSMSSKDSSLQVKVRLVVYVGA
jgi:hypothetical protein